MGKVAATSLTYALKTHTGMVRVLNEDVIGAQPHLGLFVLADGLGGYSAGEIAATMAVSQLLSRLPHRMAAATKDQADCDPATVLRQELIELNAQIYRTATQDSSYEGMASTVVMAWFLAGHLWSMHAGDSRLYRWRQGQLTILTRDHSFSQELLDAGVVTPEEVRLLPSRNLVTRALGATDDIEAEVAQYEVQAGDWYLLCSDGLNGEIEDAHIARILLQEADDVNACAHALVDAALAAGGHDNCSVILIQAH